MIVPPDSCDPMYQSSYVLSFGAASTPSRMTADRCSWPDHTTVAVPPPLTFAVLRWKSGAA